jgi:hypothetical protein
MSVFVSLCLPKGDGSKKNANMPCSKESKPRLLSIVNAHNHALGYTGCLSLTRSNQQRAS